MVFVVDVKEETRDTPGAITRVDGTTRILPFSKATSAKYCGLIGLFAERAGMHMALNTSFNDNVEA